MNDPEKSIFPGVESSVERSALWGQGCGCWTCVGRRMQEAGTPWQMPFIVCPDCGNKRCPKATHHDKECTGSNAVGQEGSRYA